jgi:predicted transcriptional regulator
MTLATSPSVLLSVRPRFADALLNGSKTIEIRRRTVGIRPGATCLIYASSPQRALVGAARLGAIHVAEPAEIWRRWGDETALSRDEFDEYLSGRDLASALEVAAVAAFERPLALHELRERHAAFLAPQSYRYLDAAESGQLLNGEAVHLSLLGPGHDDRLF